VPLSFGIGLKFFELAPLLVNEETSINWVGPKTVYVTGTERYAPPLSIVKGHLGEISEVSATPSTTEQTQERLGPDVMSKQLFQPNGCRYKA
jgi:hypothetical protein